MKLYKVKFDQQADKTIAKWKKSNAVLYKKLLAVLADIAMHPRTGIAHPEPLVNGDGETYSRRISASERIIYSINDDEVIVIVVQLGGHYSDK